MVRYCVFGVNIVGLTPIIYLKDVEGMRECVRVGNCILTPNHLVYSGKGNFLSPQFSFCILLFPSCYLLMV
jgi:hypothetical protein